MKRKNNINHWQLQANYKRTNGGNAAFHRRPSRHDQKFQGRHKLNSLWEQLRRELNSMGLPNKSIAEWWKLNFQHLC
uniref:Uncharacterized protein n=1 Tax=Glossina pallidipes TaxID=7398 RepID=A0A1A9ZYA9_GLOPL